MNYHDQVEANHQLHIFKEFKVACTSIERMKKNSGSERSKMEDSSNQRGKCRVALGNRILSNPPSTELGM